LSTPASEPSRPVLCPYCGHTGDSARRCEACGGYFDPLSRQASQNAMGPWFVRDPGRPFLPGCSYETLRARVARGSIALDAAIRGPTTRQFWTPARRTPGVAHLLGVCHACGGGARAEDERCASCGATFVHEPDRQHLGLAPVHLLPRSATPEQISESLPPPSAPPSPAAPPSRRSRALARLVVAGALLLAGSGGLVFGLAMAQRRAAQFEPAPLAAANAESVPEVLDATPAEPEPARDDPSPVADSAPAAEVPEIARARSAAAGADRREVEQALADLERIAEGAPGELAHEIESLRKALQARLLELILRERL
jgi:hypothetical protein